MSIEKQFANHEKATGRDLTSSRAVAGLGNIVDAQLNWNSGERSLSPGGVPFTEKHEVVAGIAVERTEHEAEK